MSTQQSRRITIIGGGAIGCAIAYAAAHSPHNEVVLVDKQPITKARNQSSHNSGVIHAGINYSQHQMPLKAKLCVEGNKMLYDFCQQFKIPHIKTGKLVVATNQQEGEYLDDVLRIAIENGIPIQRLNAEEARRYEPKVNVSAALLASTSGIIYAPAYIEKLIHLLKACDNIVGDMISSSHGYEVIGITEKGTGFEVTVKTTDSRQDISSWETDIVINSAGLYSDVVAKMINPDSAYEIAPVRGEAAKFYKTRRPEIHHAGLNIYPAPHGIYEDGTRARIGFEEFQKLLEQGRIFKTVGVHLTPTFDMDSMTGECLYDEEKGEYVLSKTVTVGPAFVGNIGKEDYSPTVPIQFFYDNVRDFFPCLRLEDLELHDTGIMARLKGGLDFVIENDPRHERFINLIGMDSPGLTSSLAIARYVVDTYLK